MLTLTTNSPTSLAGQPPAASPPVKASRSLPNLAPLGEQAARDLVQLFKLLSDDTRLRILHFLTQQDELNVCTLCDLLDESQPAVSHHLVLSRAAGVLECRRDGKHNFYRIVPKQCQAYLDVVFDVSGDETRTVRVQDAVLTYGHDGQAATPDLSAS